MRQMILAAGLVAAATALHAAIIAPADAAAVVCGANAHALTGQPRNTRCAHDIMLARGLIMDGDAMFPGAIMPSFDHVTGFTCPDDALATRPAPDARPPFLAAQDIEDVVAYLMTPTAY